MNREAIGAVPTWREFSTTLESGDPYAFGTGVPHYPELPPAEISRFRAHLLHALHFFQCALTLREAQTLDDHIVREKWTAIRNTFHIPANADKTTEGELGGLI